MMGGADDERAGTPPPIGPLLLVSPTGRARASASSGRADMAAGCPEVKPIPAVFLDRDGVINENRPDYVKSWAEFDFLPGVFEPLRRLATSPYLVVVVSNQSAVGRGLSSCSALEDVHRRMVKAIDLQGGRVDAGSYCLHRPVDRCACRKPLPGQVVGAAGVLGIDLARSFLVGDALSDVQAAIAAGCTPVLVLTGRGHVERSLLPREVLPLCHVAEDLGAAVEWILHLSTSASESKWHAGRAYDPC